MLEFQEIKPADAAVLRAYYADCAYVFCGYSLGQQLIGGQDTVYSYAEAEGCLIVCRENKDGYQFLFPVSSEKGDVEAALDKIDEFCVEKQILPCYLYLPSACVPMLEKRYDRCRVYHLAAWQEYIYKTEELLAAADEVQAEQIDAFYGRFPTAVFHLLGRSDVPRLQSLCDVYTALYGTDDLEASRSIERAKKLIKFVGSKHFFAGGVEFEGKIIGFCIGERCASTLVLHVEFGVPGFDGIYSVMLRGLAQYFAKDGVHHINRGEDGLNRDRRIRYINDMPYLLYEKYCLNVINELALLREFPQISTARLTIHELQIADEERYLHMLQDKDRNQYWGCDDFEILNGEEPNMQRFIEAYRKMFAAGRMLDLGVYLDGILIGEVTLYNFDGRGRAEYGGRIMREYAHNGYGAEAVEALQNWALYTLGLRRILGRCFHGNRESYHMMEKFMSYLSQDDTYYYFCREL